MVVFAQSVYPQRASVHLSFSQDINAMTLMDLLVLMKKTIWMRLASPYTDGKDKYQTNRP